MTFGKKKSYLRASHNSLWRYIICMRCQVCLIAVSFVQRVAEPVQSLAPLGTLSITLLSVAMGKLDSATPATLCQCGFTHTSDAETSTNFHSLLVHDNNLHHTECKTNNLTKKPKERKKQKSSIRSHLLSTGQIFFKERLTRATL